MRIGNGSFSRAVTSGCVGFREPRGGHGGRTLRRSYSSQEQTDANVSPARLLDYAGRCLRSAATRSGGGGKYLGAEGPRPVTQFYPQFWRFSRDFRRGGQGARGRQCGVLWGRLRRSSRVSLVFRGGDWLGHRTGTGPREALQDKELARRGGFPILPGADRNRRGQ